MQSAIVQMILIVVGIAAAAMVTIIVYSQLNSNAPAANNQGNIDYTRVTTEKLCLAVGGTWDDAAKIKCSA